MPEKQWKRPMLFILSFTILIGGGYLFSINEHPYSKEPITLMLLALVSAVLILAIIVSIIGCNRCVARIFGDL